MDDANLPVFRIDGNLDEMVEQVDVGLRKANFNVKDWTKTGQDKKIKFLSYDYNALLDTFSLRVKCNFSPKKRGIRSSPNFESLESFAGCVRENGLT